VPVCARSCLLLCVAIAVAPEVQAGAPIVTPSSFSVTPQGAASYEVPIRVAPGIAGVEPKLSFSYNSQGSNGIVGIGWGLIGLSAIMRCAETIAQDGIHGAVSFNASDRFCLDGKRLKLFNPSNSPSLQYWAAGATNEYRTEIASFTKVVANGAAGKSGPAWFKIWTKSGEIMEYGNTADSQITGNGSFTPLIWAINKITDRYGNYIQFTYSQPNNGVMEFYPSTISYTGNATLTQAPNQQVVFSYETRSDPISAYGPAGITTHTGQILSSVQVLAGTNNAAGATLVRTYTLTYAPSSVSSRSLLQSIQECSPTNTTLLKNAGTAAKTCRPALTFDWPQNVSGDNLLAPYPLFSGGSVGGWSLARVADYVADVNGDGLSDLVRLWFDGTATDPAYAQVTLSSGTSFSVASNNTVGPWGTMYTQTGGSCPPIGGCAFVEGFVNLFADVNGDGKADLVRIHNTGAQYTGQLMLSNGAGFNAATFNGEISPYGVFADAVPTYYDNSSVTGLSYEQTSVNFKPLLEDITGDGRADLVLIGASVAVPGASAVTTLASTGNTFAAPATTTTGPASTSYEPAELVVLGGDVDGDGRADAIELFSECTDVTNPIGGQLEGASCPTRIARLLVSNGSTLVAQSDVNVGAGGDGSGATSQYFMELTADINGDGKTDLIRIRNSNPGSTSGTAIADVWLSTGTTLVKSGSFTLGPYIAAGQLSEFLPIDVNGDGRTDLVVVTSNNGQAEASVYLSNGSGFAATPDATWTAIGAWDPVNNEDLPMDVNGDGRIDLVRLTNKSNTAVANIATLPGTPFDVITAFHNGLGLAVTLNYQTIGEQGVPPPPSGQRRAMRMYAPHGPPPPGMPTLTLYAKGSSSQYPLLDFSGPMKVVAWVETDAGTQTSGTENVNNVTYGYSNGVIDLSGRGFLGFGRVQQEDNTADILTTTNYSQSSSPSSSSFPYIGMITSKQTTAPLQATLAGTQPTAYLLGTTTNTFAQVLDDNNSPYPFIQTSVEQGYGLTTGNELPTVTTQSVYDMWGNATKMTVTTTPVASSPADNPNDKFSTVTNSTYKSADTVNWILGRLTQSTATNAVSASPVVTPQSLSAFSASVGPQSGGSSTSLGTVSATATVTPTGGVVPVVYTWSGGGNGITASQTGPNSPQVTFSRNFSAYGSYSATFTVTARDAAGRTASAIISATLSASAPATAVLAFSGCSSNSPTTTPTVAALTCTLSNTGQAAASSISYSAISGATVSGPTAACAAGASCGSVTVTSGTAAGTYSGTLTASPNAGSAASISVNLVVNSATAPAALAFSACSSTSPTSTPTPATLTCTLSNTGQTATSSIGYSAISGATVSGPTGACAANSACGTVTVTSGTAVGTYGGTLTATPNAGSAASTPVSLVVNSAPTPAALAFSACSSASPTTAPTAASQTCTLSNTGQTAISSISYSTISGATVSGPTGSCGGNAACGSVTVTSGTTAGTYSGTLTATPNTGSAASVAVSLIVNAPVPPAALVFSGCSSTSPTFAPTAAVLTCTLTNTGQTAGSSISYSAITGATVSGPTGACGVNAACGTVTVTSGTTAGTYSGTLTATPNAGTAASTSVSLTVNATCADTSVHSFSYTGAVGSIAVPAHCGTLYVVAGGGGGGGDSSGSYGGGGAGAVAKTYTGLSGGTIYVSVGGAGQTPLCGAAGGWGNGAGNGGSITSGAFCVFSGGSGGGSSCVSLNTSNTCGTASMIACASGGAGGNSNLGQAGGGNSVLSGGSGTTSGASPVANGDSGGGGAGYGGQGGAVDYGGSCPNNLQGTTNMGAASVPGGSTSLNGMAVTGGAGGASGSNGGNGSVQLRFGN